MQNIDLGNRPRLIVSSMFTVSFLAIVVLMVLNLVFRSQITALGFVKTIPLAVIIVDGGDRVIRYFVDIRRRIKLRRIRKKIAESQKGVRLRVKSPRRLRPSDGLEEFELKPYRVVAAVHNIEREWNAVLKNLAPCRHNLFIVDDCSTDGTFDVIRRSGVEIIRNPRNTKKPGAILYGLRQLPAEIETVVVIDPDVELPARTSIERAIYDLQRSGAGACSVNVLPRLPRDGRRKKLLLFQALEYEFSMYCGRQVPHNYVVHSGACGIFKREALEQTLSHSSRSVYGEDFETSLSLMSSGWRTYHDPRVLVRTDVPASLWKFTLQRMGWYFGFAKVVLSSFWKVRKCKNSFLWYQFYFYDLVVLLLAHPFRVVAAFMLFISILAYALAPISPAIAGLQLLPMSVVLFVAGFYMFFGLEGYFGSVTLKKRDWPAIIVYPLFMLYQQMIPISLGYLNYATWVFFGRKVIKDPYGPRSRAKAIIFQSKPGRHERGAIAVPAIAGTKPGKHERGSVVPGSAGMRTGRHELGAVAALVATTSKAGRHERGAIAAYRATQDPWKSWDRAVS